MPVNLILQNDQGTITNANAYIKVTDPLADTQVMLTNTTITGPFGFYQYHRDRGQVEGTFDAVDSAKLLSVLVGTKTFTYENVAAAIVKATDYIDKRFTFIGFRRYSNQPTSWPRWDAVDINDRYLKGIPLAVQQATAEYALRALLLTQLVADPKRDATGQRVRSQTKKVGPLETATTFEGGFQMPKYPAADAILRSWGLIVGGGQIVRG